MPKKRKTPDADALLAFHTESKLNLRNMCGKAFGYFLMDKHSLNACASIRFTRRIKKKKKVENTKTVLNVLSLFLRSKNPKESTSA